MNAPTHDIISRRTMLALSGGGTALLTATAGGCGFFSTDPQGATDDVGSDGDTTAKESPTLTKKVEAGELEPLAERLPKNPMVVEVGEPGLYGGTWHSVTVGPGDDAAFDRIAGYQPLLRKNPMVTENVLNLAESFEQSADAKQFTIKIREGLRWSDGKPFTADDMIFALEDVLGNTDIYPSPTSWISQNGVLAQGEKIDDVTIKINFDKPNGLFPELAAHYTDLVRLPKHYASQFLPKYNDKAEDEAKEKGFDAWVDYFTDRTDSKWTNPDLPVLDAWHITTPLGEGTQVVLERNPYFWKTDQDGRQLPYIDTLSFEVVMDPEVMVLKTTDGEIDLIYRHVDLQSNKPVFAKSAEKGGYQIVDLLPTNMTVQCLALNLANKNKDHRELYQNKDFRIGLSHAINREELITAVYQRQGEPWQAAPTKDSEYYDEEFAKQYTEFDLDLANEHLDKAGITERDGDDMRLLPNGKKLTINLDVAIGGSDEPVTAAGLMKNMLAKVGVRMNVNGIDRTLFSERVSSDVNETDATVWGGDGGLAVEIVEPRWYFPFSSQSFWATPWAAWFATNKSEGVEPIPRIKEQMELYWELLETPDEAARKKLFNEILAIAKEEFWAIGTASAANPYLVVSNRLKNVIGGVPSTAVYYTPAHANPEGWFLDDNA
jgi:peptide/nickel transport system substrate-binding protein